MSTLVVYADTADGHIGSYDGWNDDLDGWDGTYAEARAGTGDGTAVNVDGTSALTVGQYISQGDFVEWRVFESFVSFDTSSVGSGSTVSAAVLMVRATIDASDTDFTIEARLRDWGTTVEAADWVAGASLSGLTLLSHYATAGGWISTTGYDFVDDAFAANIVKTSTTRLILASANTASNTAPGGIEFLAGYAADYAGTTYDPKLTVTYTDGSSQVGAITVMLGGGL